MQHKESTRVSNEKRESDVSVNNGGVNEQVETDLELN